MKGDTMLKIWVPVAAALVGGVVSLVASQWEVFSKHQTEIDKLNNELFLRSRVAIYVDFMKKPTEDGLRHLVLMGSKDVIRVAGDLYSDFCQKKSNGKDGTEELKCEFTCPENRAFIKLYQAMRNDFQVTRMSPASDDDLYSAKYLKRPDCPPSRKGP